MLGAGEHVEGDNRGDLITSLRQEDPGSWIESEDKGKINNVEFFGLGKNQRVRIMIRDAEDRKIRVPSSGSRARNSGMFVRPSLENRGAQVPLLQIPL